MATYEENASLSNERHSRAPLLEASSSQEATPKAYPWTVLDLILDQIPSAKIVHLKPVLEDVVDWNEKPDKQALLSNIRSGGMPLLEVEWGGPGTEPKGTFHPFVKFDSPLFKSQ